MVAANVFERFSDCKITSLRVAMAAGAPPIATMSILGCDSTFEAADTVLAALTSTPYVYMEAENFVKVGGTAYRIGRCDIGISNAISGFQADGYKFADLDPGEREVTLGLLMRYVNPTTEPKYRAHYYGSDAGTTLDPTVGTRAFDVILTRNVNTSIQFTLPQVTYSAVEINADVSGNPIEVDLACDVEKPAGSNIITVVTKDQTATI